jgi:SulP family sulfate permease
MLNRISTEHLAGDLSGGIRTAFLSLPVALAFGVISGAGPMAGYYSAVAVGLFAALFGGTPAQISGPTGPTALVMAAVIFSYGFGPGEAFMVVMLAGLFQILFGVLHVGRYVNLMPYPVISGWMTGIGVVIILMQLDPLLGYGSPRDPVSAISSVAAHAGNVRPEAVLIGMASFAVALFLPGPIARVVPSPLAALVLAMLLAGFVFPEVATLPETTRILPSLYLPIPGADRIYDMLLTGLIIALLGGIDSLLGSMAADTATNTLHNSDKELVGHGIGNLAAGFLGGVPGAGAAQRTMHNVRNGGRTALSGIAHAGTLLALLPALAWGLPRLPVAGLSGILMAVAINTIDWRYLKRARTAPPTGLLLMFTVLLLTVFANLLVAVGVGVILASLLFAKRMADLQLAAVRTLDNPAGEESLGPEEGEIMARLAGRVLLVQLSGPMSFVAANGLHGRLGRYQEYDALVLDLSSVPYVDSSATLALGNIIEKARGKNHTVELVGVNMQVARMFARLGVLDLIRDCDRHATRLDALRYLAGEFGVPVPETAPAEESGSASSSRSTIRSR